MLVVGWGRSCDLPTSTPAQVAQASNKYPNAIVVLGHSGTTGYDSEPKAPETDARQNSWATGDNPAVNSIYLRLLAVNPAVRGHNLSVGVAGTGVDELVGQADQALAANPLPELFLIQSVDNDIRCDGTDPDNYAPFAATLTEVLKKITSGKPVPAHWRYLEQITLRYLGELKSVCAKFPACQHDNDALYHMRITTDDITPSDGAHLTIAGLRKQAALEWRVLGLDA